MTNDKIVRKSIQYMVTEYHLNLGPKDTLESLVDLIKLKNPTMKSSEKKDTIIDFLKSLESQINYIRPRSVNWRNLKSIGN